MDHKTGISTLEMVQMAMFTALLAISAYISIPLPFPGAPHITLQNFMILLIALLFPAAQSFLMIFVWMLLGVIGIPVFIGGKGGAGYIVASPWGGYTLAFLVIAVLLPLLRGKSYKRSRYIIVSVLGAVIIDLLGMLYLRFYPQSGYNWTMAWVAGFFSFLPLDLVKAVAAAILVPAFHRIMKKEN